MNPILLKFSYENRLTCKIAERRGEYMKKGVFGIVVLCLLTICSFAYADCSVCGGNNKTTVNRPTKWIDDIVFDTHTQYYVVDSYCADCGNFLESTTKEYRDRSYAHIWSIECINITYHNDTNYHWKEGKRIKRCEACNKMITLDENVIYDS